MEGKRSRGPAIVKKTIITYNVVLALLVTPAIVVMIAARSPQLFWAAVVLALLSPGLAGVIAFLVLKRSLGSGKT